MLFGMSLIAVISAFIYRYALLQNKLKLVLSWPFLISLGFLHCGYMMPAITFYILGTGDRAAIDRAIATVNEILKSINSCKKKLFNS